MTTLLIIAVMLLSLVLISVLAAFEIVVAKYGALDAAATKLYKATRWRSSEPKLSEHVEAYLWKDLRDALLLEPGTATALGVGDPNA
jgi:hypothetical protein